MRDQHELTLSLTNIDESGCFFPRQARLVSDLAAAQRQLESTLAAAQQKGELEAALAEARGDLDRLRADDAAAAAAGRQDASQVVRGLPPADAAILQLDRDRLLVVIRQQH